MRRLLISSLGIALLLAVVGCKSSNSSSGDSMSSMKMDGDTSMGKPTTTMPATMPM